MIAKQLFIPQHKAVSRLVPYDCGLHYARCVLKFLYTPAHRQGHRGVRLLPEQITERGQHRTCSEVMGDSNPPCSSTQNAISTIILLYYCWELWKHRHDVVFRATNPDHDRLIAACHQTTKLWQCRLPRNNTAIYSFWCTLTSAM
jgi:hypothetical protein